jgi:Ni/Fe-hydrogenase subunit HybB-like protein
MVAIGMDLGRPEKFWRLFMFFVLNNMRSLFAINGILYGGYFAITLIYLGLSFGERQKLGRRVAILAMIWAALVHMGTGAIFGFIAARLIFYSPLKPFEFLAAAMVSGLALLIIVVVLLFKITQRPLDREIVSSLGSLLVPLILILFAIVFIDKLTHLYPSDREPTLWLMTGSFSWVFWGLQVGCAFVLPILILVHPRSRKSIHGIVTAAFFILVGIFGERFVLVVPGTAYPLPVYPGKIEGMWGRVGTFHFTLTDSLISVGIFGLMGLLFLLGLKYLELLPADERSEQISAVAKNP